MSAGGDRRFTNGLIYDVVAVLEKHGYRRPDNDVAALGRTVADLVVLCRTFEGAQDGRDRSAVLAGVDVQENPEK